MTIAPESGRTDAPPALRPRLALTLGDPGGIGPELVARMLPARMLPSARTSI
jgi:4-hydroxy-L-threonine phosphate dehydrogenase PdxA